MFKIYVLKLFLHLYKSKITIEIAFYFLIMTVIDVQSPQESYPLFNCLYLMLIFT